jgi:hypothetical protein
MARINKNYSSICEQLTLKAYRLLMLILVCEQLTLKAYRLLMLILGKLELVLCTSSSLRTIFSIFQGTAVSYGF